MPEVVEIVKLVFEDCGYAFALVDPDGGIVGMQFCFEETVPYEYCQECELREQNE